jgi:hypothetical protein
VRQYFITINLSRTVTQEKNIKFYLKFSVLFVYIPNINSKTLTVKKSFLKHELFKKLKIKILFERPSCFLVKRIEKKTPDAIL